MSESDLFHTEDGSAAAWWHHIEEMERVQEKVEEGEERLNTLRETLYEFDTSSPALISVSLKMLPQFRRIAKQSTVKLKHDLTMHQYYDVNLYTTAYKDYLANRRRRDPFRGRVHLGDRNQQIVANRALRASSRHKWVETEQKVDAFTNHAMSYYRHLLLKSVEFYPFLRNYCMVPPVDTAQTLADREPWQLQHMFHMLFRGGFVCHPEDEIGVNWAIEPKSFQAAGGRFYTECRCGCQAAAERFIANMAGGSDQARELAMDDRYHECIDYNAPFIM